MTVGEPVPGASTFGDGLHQTATAQTRELVRHHLAGHPKCFGEIGRKGGRFPQCEQDADPVGSESACPNRARAAVCVTVAAGASVVIARPQ